MNRYQEWLEAKKLSESSIENYMYYYDKFEKEYTQDNINKFLIKYNNPISRAFLKHFLDYSLSSGEVDKKTIKRLSIPKRAGRKENRVIKVISRQQVHKIADGCYRERDKLMVLLTYYCGLRAGELLDLRADYFNWDEWAGDQHSNGRLYPFGKKTERIVTVPSWLMRQVLVWIRTDLVKRGHKREQPLFMLSSRRWRRILSEASKRALNRKINPHLLRHSVATYLLELGMDIAQVRDYLGHKRISTTEIYLHLNKDKMLEKADDILK